MLETLRASESGRGEADDRDNSLVRDLLFHRTTQRNFVSIRSIEAVSNVIVKHTWVP